MSETNHQLPRVLMAGSSIIIEWLFRTTTSPRTLESRLRDRVKCQVLLWLTASLQETSSSSNNNNNSSFEVLVNAIFFTNLLVILLASIDPLTKFQDVRRPRGVCEGIYRNMCLSIRNRGAATTTNKGHTESVLISALEKASPALWLALLWAYIVAGPGENKSDIDGLQFAAGMFVALNILFYMARIIYQTIGSSRGGTQESSSLPSSMSNLNESDWRHWTVSDVMQWLCETSPLSPEDSQPILTRLAWEGIDGVTLVEHLDHAALRQMDIPYGPACLLLEHVQARLIRRYPSSSSGRQEQRSYSNSIQTDPEESSTFLAQYDQEYQLSLPERRQQQQQFQRKWSHHDPAMDEEETERVREQILQRWGMPTPEIAGKGNTAKPNGKSNADTTTQLPDNSVTPEEPETKAKMLDESLLQTMPQHIRDIVERKPHLWEQVKATNLDSAEAGQTQDFSEQPTTQRAHEQYTQATPPQESEQETTEPQIPLSLLQSLPPHIREVAQRNPQLFHQMFAAKQESNDSNPGTGMSVIPEEIFEDEIDETEELLPKTNSGPNGRWLRQRPGF